MKLTEYEQSSAVSYKRSLNLWLEREGIERKDRDLTKFHFETREAQMAAYLRDSLIWTFEELEAGRALYAFRGLVQASGYAGAVGHDSITSDALIILRNILERVLMDAEEGR